jgi:hypothetical protein
MKKFITIWISCSLVLAVGALAQQEDPQSTPTKKQRKKAQSAQAAQPSAGQPAQQAPAARPHAGKRAREHGATPNNPHAAAPATNPHEQAPATGPTDTEASSNDTEKADQKKSRKGQRAPSESANSAQGSEATSTKKKSQSEGSANQPATPAPAKANAGAQGEAQASAAPQPNNAQASRNKGTGKAKKPADVQKIKAQHANFRAQPKPEKVPAVTFNESRKISGSEHWQGTQYTVFRSYRPQWHDQNWYHSRYDRIVLIAGGYYFFNAGYWYPAWGYQPSAQYYAYDGPIYAGSQAEPPDRVIADVQASLQEMGYYTGEVDGLLGPLTREALTGYQSDNGLYVTAAIDEPTLESLGLG